MTSRHASPDQGFLFAKAERLYGAICLGFFAVSSLFLTSCTWSDGSGTHHLIVGVGFGIITTTNRAGVDVQDFRTIGAEFGSQGVGLGLMRHHRVNIEPGASNVVVSVKSTPFGLSVSNFDPFATNQHNSLATNQ